MTAWLEFLHTFNGKAFFLSDTWITSDVLHLYTDASGALGYGAVLSEEWFYGTWPINWERQAKNITLKELFPIMAALEVWGNQLANKRILLHTDNMALVHIINRTTSKENNIMKMIRKCVVKCMLCNIHIKAEHVPGCENVLADNLSRQQVETFRRHAPWAAQAPVTLPPAIQPCNCCLD